MIKKLSRLLAVHNMIAEARFSAETMAYEVGFSQAQIEKDIHDLRAFGIPIKHDKRQDVYYLRNRNVEFWDAIRKQIES